jgi:probable poly-beta-1,6-N-acetyl-D-glucosamine export protein
LPRATSTAANVSPTEPDLPAAIESGCAATAEPATTQAKKGVFLENVHLFRGVAILAVVATHVLFELNWTEDRRTQFRISLSLVQNGTLSFVFVAGLLFRHLAYRFEYRKYLVTKLKYVILPYLIISLPYVYTQHQRGFGIFRPDVYPTDSNLAVYVLGKYLSGEQMPIPLWFVPMISVLYLLAPVLLWLDARRWGYWTIPPLLVLASFIHRPLEQTMLRQSVFYFLPVYLVGMWVARYMTQVMCWTRRLRWFAMAIIAAILCFEVIARQRPGALESAHAFSTEMGVFDVNNYMKLLLALVVLEALQRCPPWLATVLDRLATLSFGIFFVHFYWLYFARDLRLALDVQWPGTPWMLALLTMVTVSISVGFLAVIRKLFGQRSRFLVGC